MTISQVKEVIKGICAKRSNLVFMDKTSLLVDGVRVLGTTLWSDIPVERQRDVWRSLNDYNLISVDDAADRTGAGARLATPADTVAMFEDELAWLESELARAKAAGENCVVLTHHTPSKRGTSAPQFEHSPINCAFSSSLEHLFREKGTTLHTWIFGHTHYNNDFVMRGTRLVADQRGYVGMEPCRGYRNNAVLHVPLLTGGAAAAGAAMTRSS